MELEPECRDSEFSELLLLKTAADSVLTAILYLAFPCCTNGDTNSETRGHLPRNTQLESEIDGLSTNLVVPLTRDRSRRGHH